MLSGVVINFARWVMILRLNFNKEKDMKFRTVLRWAVVTICVMQLGCATPRKQSRSDLRKVDMQTCVTNFLGQDVAPSDSLAICNSIYERWRPSVKSQKGGML